MFGLPLHPLVVHAVVVLLPLGALAFVAVVVAPGLRQRYSLPALATLTVGAASAVAARFSGVELARTLPEPATHATFGTLTTVVALVLTALAWGWWFLDRRDAARPGRRGLAAMATGSVGVTIALATVVLVVLTGHSGATATWTSRLAQPPAAPQPAASGTATADAAGGGSATPAATPTYTLADVAQHADAGSCWAAVDGGVYDLTRWVALHPGGAERILALCGTDATDRFTAQHDGASRPETTLAGFRIGDLA